MELKENCVFFLSLYDIINFYNFLRPTNFILVKMQFLQKPCYFSFSNCLCIPKISIQTKNPLFFTSSHWWISPYLNLKKWFDVAMKKFDFFSCFLFKLCFVETVNFPIKFLKKFVVEMEKIIYFFTNLLQIFFFLYF